MGPESLMPFGNVDEVYPARGDLRRKLSEQAAPATDGKTARRRRNPRGVTKRRGAPRSWGPAHAADKPPQGRFAGLRS
jgi:hypothetical protein